MHIVQNSRSFHILIHLRLFVIASSRSGSGSIKVKRQRASLLCPTSQNSSPETPQTPLVTAMKLPCLNTSVCCTLPRIQPWGCDSLCPKPSTRNHAYRAHMLHVCIYVFMHVDVCICLCLAVYVYVSCTCTGTCTSTCTSMCVYVFMYLCM